MSILKPLTLVLALLMLTSTAFAEMASWYGPGYLFK